MILALHHSAATAMGHKLEGRKQVEINHAGRHIMSKTIFVSNRLPVTVEMKDGKAEYKKSIGGLATGLKTYHEQADSLWVGWPGFADDDLDDDMRLNMSRELKTTFQCLPVFLSSKEIDQYYQGFSNNTIWPLFHYFQSKTQYDFKNWSAYVAVNQKFFEALEPLIEDQDVVWIHDYQLMLLPQLVKDKYPNTQVGFFLHIPFPSTEVFRMLIWREEILCGLLGADLIGFHTYDYVRHFLSAARRILGLEHSLNRIIYEDRYVQVDAFPMGIDYERFAGIYDDNAFLEETEMLFDCAKDSKIILSIDRLDYTKGIPERIRAFGRLLSKYPEYLGKVRLYLIVAPSRVEVESYEELRKEITQKVSDINGKYGTVNWMPIWFFFQTFSQESLIAFYRYADVLLVTPLRDGMNLVVKEYIAARTDYEGMAVISETAGAASELGEAVIVNANNYHEVATGIKTALEMPREEKIARNKSMHKRLKRYTVEFWAGEFLRTLENTFYDSLRIISEKFIEKFGDEIVHSYNEAKQRILFLDYDGTLVGFAAAPEQAKPDERLRALLKRLSSDPKNTIVIVSGRDRHSLEEWLGDLNLTMLAEHGLWLRTPGQEWSMTVSLNNDWKDQIRHVLEIYTDRMPGSFIEEKDYALAFHYRQSEPDLVATKYREIHDTLASMTHSMELSLQEGNKVLEIKDSRSNKGYGASLLLQNSEYDFILGAGDDHTDEDLFSFLPDFAYTIKIGLDSTRALYRTKSWSSMRRFLERLADQS